MLTVQITSCIPRIIIIFGWDIHKKSGCEKGIHLKPVHPDQCIKEEDDFGDDDVTGAGKAIQDEQQQNDPTSSSPSFAERYQGDDRIQSPDLLSVTSQPPSSNSNDANDLEDESNRDEEEDDDVDDTNEDEK